MNKLFAYLKNFDWILFVAVLLLVCFGLAEIYSIALSKGDISLLNLKKQFLFAVIGIVLLFLLSFFDFYNLQSYNVHIYIVGIVVLVIVLVLGTTVRGTTGWFEFGIFRIQPVEFIKLILIVFLARYFSGISININPLKHLIFSGLGTGVFVFLILKQPDFGSAFILCVLWVLMVVIAGFKKRYIAGIVMIFFLLGAMSLLFIVMFINIGMNIGLLPVVGISLPFLSYGGSSLLASLALVGMAESIIIRSKIKY